jgi:uridine phosphorylase
VAHWANCMLRELKKSEWLELLNLTSEMVPHALVLRGTRNLKLQYQAHVPHFEDIVHVGSPNGVFEDVLVGRHRGVRIGYASIYGAAMASEITHLFGVLGTRLVIQTGCCGALAPHLEAGDLFVTEEAFCGEGAAQYYLPDTPIVRSSIAPGDWRALERAADIPLHSGRIYTTSALLAEGHQELESWSAAGFAAVDMETATTFAVSEHFGMDRASILFVFDNPRKNHHMLLSDSQRDERRARANGQMIELALKMAVRHAAKTFAS